MFRPVIRRKIRLDDYYNEVFYDFERPLTNVFGCPWPRQNYPWPRQNYLPGFIQRYEGTCDVCGEEISIDYDTAQGAIDIGATEEGRVYTWIRHIDGPCQPECDIYSSRVYEVPWPRESDEKEAE